MNKDITIQDLILEIESLKKEIEKAKNLARIACNDAYMARVEAFERKR